MEGLGMIGVRCLFFSLLFINSALLSVMEICQGKEILYVGSYTHKKILAHSPKSNLSGKGIYRFALEHDGALEFLGHTESTNPAVLQIHPKKEMLYALSERIDRNGEIKSFLIQEDGSLTLQNSFQAAGKSTCFLQFEKTNKFGIVVNYWDAFIDVVRFDSKGLPVHHVQNFRQQYRGISRQVLERDDHWQNRQVGPHAHSAHFWENRVFIPDLGERAIFQYTFSSDNFLKEEAVIKLAEGSGPRHMVINAQSNMAYISDELKNVVIVAKLDKSNFTKRKPRLTPIQYLPTIPENSGKSYVSEILLSPDNRFVYVSNRGHDSISIFRVNQENGTLSLIGSIPTGGEFPRHFSISPSGNFLVVANQDSDLITVFVRDPKSGLIHRLDQAYNIPSPNYIQFLDRN